jgi:hypothetical protein
MATKKTLDQCTKLLDNHRDMINNQQMTPGASRKADFPLEGDEINLLRFHLSTHERTILGFAADSVM